MRYAVLRTHGGLGNQLFQILFGRLLSEQLGLELREVHDDRYRHAFQRSSSLEKAPAPTIWQSILSSARLPKIAERYMHRVEGPLWLGRSAYLDAYFQGPAAYEGFTAAAVSRQIDRLARELKISEAYIDARLVHLRLGDFFSDRTQARNHVLERLSDVAPGSWVITNDEPLLQDPDVARRMTTRDLKLVSTKGMAAEMVLQTMARYQMIDANDSTLTFWSSVLGGCEVALRDPRLRACRDLLVQCRASGRAAC
jgi:hypothetical protein